MSKRAFEVDLLRIIATLLVIILHIMGQGGILDAAALGGVNFWAAWYLEILAYCAVNCFALISGYIMVDKAIKVKHITGLWFQVFFYSFLITVVYFVMVPEARTMRNLVCAFFPVVGEQWWYISSYFALYFMIPFLNAAISHTSRKNYEKFLILILIGVCVIESAVPMDAFGLKDGYSAIWLIVLYLFGAYIKKYDLKQKLTAWQSMLGFFAMISLTFLSKFVIHYATKTIFGEIKYDNLFVSYTSITIVLAAVFAFLFCLNAEIGKPIQRVIGLFAPATLGVYLIHVHPLVFEYIMKDAFVSFAHKPLFSMILCVLTAASAIFVLCSIIEWIRIRIFKLMQVNRLCEMLDHKISDLCLKIWKE